VTVRYALAREVRSRNKPVQSLGLWRDMPR